jgi:hypothetical protein
VNWVDPSGLDTVNGNPFTMMSWVNPGDKSPAAVARHRAAYDLNNPPGVYSYAGHGGIDPRTGKFVIWDPFGNPVTPEAFVRGLDADPRFHRGETTVLLDVCGAGEGRGDSFAADVSILSGSRVIAPNNITGINTNYNHLTGKLWESSVGTPYVVAPGQFLQFDPTTARITAVPYPQ